MSTSIGSLCANSTEDKGQSILYPGTIKMDFELCKEHTTIAHTDPSTTVNINTTKAQQF